MRVACALTRFFDQCSCVCSAAQMAWPRACAARIIATLESLYALRDSSGSTMKRSAAAKLENCGLLGLRHHEIDRGADLGLSERRVAGLGRHRAQAALSPILGALATPVWWQVAQTDFTTSSPLRAPAAPPPPAANSTRPTGWMRAATASGVIAFGSAPGALSTSCTSSTMPMIGIAKESSTTTISCCGVLMNEECWSCVLTMVLLVGER